MIFILEKPATFQSLSPHFSGGSISPEWVDQFVPEWVGQFKPKRKVFKNNTIGSNAFCCNSTNLL